MYPPSAPMYHNTRTRWYGDPVISRERLKELLVFRGLKVKRIRIKEGIPEYMEITSDGEYFNVSVIRDAQMYHYDYHGRGLMDLIIWLNEHGWSSGI